MDTDTVADPDIVAAITTWVEHTTGESVTSIAAQDRWRPAFFITTDRARYYFRGARDAETQPLLHREAALLDALHGAGITVPRCFGELTEPPGILLEHVDGESVFHRADPLAQEAIAEQFLVQMARWHALPTDAFAAADLPAPTTVAEHHLMDLDVLEGAYRSGIRHGAEPSALLEFTIRWLRANVPTHAGPTVLVQGDTGPGQFLFDGERLTAIIDWELAKFGDPMYELACIRGRDLSTPFGDLRRRFARYAELSGNAVDPELLAYHTVRTLLITPIAIHPMFALHTVRGADVSIYESWDVVYSRSMVQALAEATGTPLEAVEMPAPSPSPRHKIFEAIGEELAAGSVSTSRYRSRSVRLLLDHLAHAETLGPACDAATIADAAALSGRPCTSFADAQRAVRDVVLDEAWATRTAELITFFWRDFERRFQLLGPLAGGLAATARDLRPAW